MSTSQYVFNNAQDSAEFIRLQAIEKEFDSTTQSRIRYSQYDEDVSFATDRQVHIHRRIKP